jgi:CRISPR/Cas system-associated protein Cas10 (large subunit of type III CRISPR-Cas system)
MRILLISILFFSCVSEKKLVKFCAEKYPCDTTIVKIDTSFFSDTQYIKTETIDTFIVSQNKTIVEVKYVESTAKLQQAVNSHKKALNESNKYNINIILELNRTLDKVAKDTARLSDKVRKLEKEKAELKTRLKSANNFKWSVIAIGVILVLIVFLNWFKPRLF